MGVLINPLGWRVKYRRYWATNLMIYPQSFMFSYHLQREFFEIIANLLRYITVRDSLKHFTLFSLLGFNLYIQNSGISVLLRIRFHTRQLWHIFFQKRQDIRYLKAQYFKTRKRPKQTFNICVLKKYSHTRKIRRILTKKAIFRTKLRFIKRRVFQLLNKKYPLRRRLLINRVDPFLTPRRYTRSSKRIWVYFLVLPYLIYIKRLLIGALMSKLVHIPSVKIFFVGVNQRSINATIIIDFIVRKIEQRQFRISRIIYDTLRILKRLVKTQKFVGYKFLMAGRFSRRDRATYIWKGYSSIPLSTKVSNIDYQYRYLQMRYSLGVFKLWISRR